MEVVVTLALSALLMAGLIGVLRGLESEIRLQEPATKVHGDELVLAAIRRDLQKTVFISQQSGWLWLDGEFLSLAIQGECEDRVGYGSSEWQDGKPILVRKTLGRIDPLAPAVTGIAAERLDSRGQPQPISHIPVPISHGVRIWIYGDENQLLVNDDIVVK